MLTIFHSFAVSPRFSAPPLRRRSRRLAAPHARRKEAGSDRTDGMINTQQLFEMVVERPDRSSCDLRFLACIWDAFTHWAVGQLEARVGIKVLGLGEFGFRKDVIGEMEFFNPMFIMRESERTRAAKPAPFAAAAASPQRSERVAPAGSRPARSPCCCSTQVGGLRERQRAARPEAEDAKCRDRLGRHRHWARGADHD